MLRRKYTAEDRYRALRLYKAGMSGPKVEAVTGIEKSSVQKWARKQGIVRPRSIVQLSKRDKKEIENLYLKNKHSCQQISLITGIPEYQVFYYLRKHGKTRSRAKARRLREWKRQQRSHA